MHPLQRVLLKLKTSRRLLPQSPLAKAMEYALCQWNTLTVYLADGSV